MPDLIPVKDGVEVQGVKLQRLSYQLYMQCLAATGQTVAAFGLLAWLEASGLVSSADENFCDMFRVLIEACRSVNEVEGASRAQAALDRLGLIACPPLAAAHVQTSNKDHQLRSPYLAENFCRPCWERQTTGSFEINDYPRQL
eukprot:gnl/TRDRNA2_/TRDRNA2_162155_c2_seq3.p1 gnl/TRDRNA2_/TRDRNA2_162155_c2~~gnl/TRDRNA2_/TRDRNA2_162155_c2_seq3.p1  ORF type:complete len:143 (-),score=22.31 gnl/TRDRNA2_/TRDRNA2_162155_c2_seq3:30-458(-)